MTTTETNPIDEARLEAFVGQAVADMGAAISGLLLHLGDRLGLYKAMAGAGPLTSAALVARTGTAERYVREWLGNQAAGDYVTYDPAEGTYELPAEQAMVVANEASPFFLGGAFEAIASCYADHARFTDAFRTGAGVGWHEHDDRLFSGVLRLFRPGYAAHLVSAWLPALDGVVDKLQAGASVADVGCGLGASTIIMAQAFGRSTFLGVDNHEASIAQARKAAAEAGVAQRTRFETASASVTTLSASRVLPTPPGPTAVTRRCFPSAAASAARSASRPTKEVSGDGSGGAAAGESGAAERRVAAAAASARRSVTWSLRSSEDTWLSTVRTEMNSRVAISALVRCSPSAASTSASRADTPTPEAIKPVTTLRLCPTPGRPGRPRVNAVSAPGLSALC